jgi:hypothetical protein
MWQWKSRPVLHVDIAAKAGNSLALPFAKSI